MNTRICAILLLIVGLSSCGDGKPSQKTGTAPQRIVSIVPSVTEIIYDIGKGDNIVGVCTSCNFPERAKSIPRVADMNIDIEKLLQAKPDVVLTTDLRKIENERLSQAGINVVTLRENTISDILNAYVQIGTVLGCKSDAEAAAKRFREKIDNLPRLEKPVRYFVEFGSNPIWTFSSNTYSGEILAKVGFHNIVDGKVKDWGTIDWEVVVREDPDVIFVLHTDVEGVLNRPGANSLKSAKGGKIIRLDPDLLLRSGPRLADGARQAYDAATR